MSPKISLTLLAAQSDQRLVALVNEGHERAFEALVQRYRRPLLRYCRGMGMPDGRAEDVLQQAFLQAWQVLGRGAQVRELRPWLYRVVHNTAVNAMRGPSTSHAELTEAIQARAAVAGESNIERTIAVREALTDVAALPQMQRQAIFLTAVDGQSHDEVALALGISHGALRGLLYRARVALRSAAAALTPQPLIDWASSGSGPAGPSAERLAELTAGGGGAGLAGLLLKGGVVAVTAGALATGASVVEHHTHAAHAASDRGSVAGVAHAARPSGAAAVVASVRDSPIASTPPAVAVGRTQGARHGERPSARRGARHRHSSEQGGLGQSGHADLLAGVGGSGGHGDAQSGSAANVNVADLRGGGSSGGSGDHGAAGKDGHGSGVSGRDSGSEAGRNGDSVSSSGLGSDSGGSAGQAPESSSAAPSEAGTSGKGGSGSGGDRPVTVNAEPPTTTSTSDGGSSGSGG